jgi:hypothetical protein
LLLGDKERRWIELSMEWEWQVEGSYQTLADAQAGYG